MNKIISFIVPSFNCEKFISKCLDSFLNVKVLDKIEVIVVNDGSSDRTEEIALGYQTRYPDSFKVVSQQNKGHGGAINTGTKSACGKYLKPIDADDWVVTENLPAFIKALERCQSDVVLTHHHTIDMSTGEKLKWMTYPEEFYREYTLSEIMDNWKSFDRSLTFHGICYRTDFYKQNALELSEHIFYEDHEFATIPCCLAESITPFDMFIYQYRVGDLEQSVSDLNQLKRLSHTEAVLMRFIKEQAITDRAADKNGAKRYYEQKAQGLLLSYFTTAALVDSDKKRGRQNALRLMNIFREKMPGAAAIAEGQFKIFMYLNKLRISKKTYKRILSTRIYNKLRHNHSFS